MRQRVAIGVVLIMAAAVAYLALRNPQAPILPADEEHASFVEATPCMTCHGPDGGLPRSKNHPIGKDCTRCHGYPR
jgi:hypothetical protein